MNSQNKSCLRQENRVNFLIPAKFNSATWLYSILLLLAAISFLNGCSKSPSGPNPPAGSIDLSVDLLTAEPELVGIDSVKLSAALNQADTIKGLRGLIVLKDGKIVVEQYYGSNEAGYVNDVRSVTKSVISILIGIAIGEGFIKDVNESMAKLLEPVVSNIDDEKKAITLEHLLTMSAGFQWTESGAIGYNEWITAPDQVTYVINRPLSDEPGQRWNYNSATSHLLSVILTEATDMTTFEFADEYLFEPLGIFRRGWLRDTRGYYNGGAGLQISDLGMAKIGLLFLQKGFSGNRRVVHPDWIKKSTEVHQTLSWSNGVMSNVNYGYLWWLHNGAPNEAFLAWGYGGQFIYCVPDLNLVVTTSAQWQGVGEGEPAQAIAIQNLIVNHILPSVR